MVNTFVLQTSVLKGYVENVILKNVGNQTVAGSHWLPLYFSLHTMEVNDYQQLFGYRHYSKYILFSTGE